VAGNVENPDILGSMEFACKLAGAKVVLVMGHTSCGAIKGAIDREPHGITRENQTRSGDNVVLR
jgi:carbonic anhydrase